MALSDAVVLACAARLEEARRTRVPVALLTDEAAEMTIADGYRIQEAGVAGRTRAGERVAGYKVGLTSAAPRAELGMDEPIAGRVFAATVWPSGAEVDTSRLNSPGAEAEVAFLLGRDLVGPGVTLHDAMLAVEGALAAIEIVDTRYRTWKLTGPDLAADNGCNAGIVLASRPVPLSGLDLPLEGLVWEQNGQLAATATAAEVSGTPLGSVVWLANRLAEGGIGLRAGDIVMSGSIARILRPRAGESVRATFSRLGPVSARFV